MNARRIRVEDAVEHGKPLRIVPSRFGKDSVDPVLDDLLADAVALSNRMAASQIKHLAKAGAISGQSASRWRTEGKGSPLYDMTRVIYYLVRMAQNPGAIIAHFKATLAQALMPTTDAELIERFWTLMRMESESEGRENVAEAMFGLTGDLKALETATLEEAGYQEELVAVCRELRRRRIDPRNYEGN